MRPPSLHRPHVRASLAEDVDRSAVPHGLRGYFTGQLLFQSLSLVPQMVSPSMLTPLAKALMPPTTGTTQQ